MDYESCGIASDSVFDIEELVELNVQISEQERIGWKRNELPNIDQKYNIDLLEDLKMYYGSSSQQVLDEKVSK